MLDIEPFNYGHDALLRGLVSHDAVKTGVLFACPDLIDETEDPEHNDDDQSDAEHGEQRNHRSDRARGANREPRARRGLLGAEAAEVPLGALEGHFCAR